MPTEVTATPPSSTRRRLGKGLGSLISAPVRIDLPPVPEMQSPAVDPMRPDSDFKTPADAAATDGNGLLIASVDEVQPDPKQPRQHFDEESLRRLAASISASGLMQPIVVRPAPSPGAGGAKYQIVAGERRWRAAQLAGLKRIPAIVRAVDDRTAAELSLVENLQREDLNPIERADAFRRLIDEFGLSHQDIAGQVGLDRTSVTNHLRLLELDEPTRLLVREGALSMGHAKALLSITNLSRRSALAGHAVKRGWSVRELEQRAKGEAYSMTRGEDDTPAKPVNRAVANAIDLGRRLSEHLGTKVQVQPGRTKGSGRLIIDFYSLDQFEGLLHRLQYKGD